MNPARIWGEKLYLDFNLASAAFFFETNYLYIHGEDYEPIRFMATSEFPKYGRREFFMDKRLSSTKRKGFVMSDIYGPGATLVYKQHAFGAQINIRSVSAFRNVPEDIANFLYETVDYPPQFDINYIHRKDGQFGTLSWMELNLTYAQNLHRYGFNSFTAGVTLKPLFGIGGSYFNLYDVDYMVDNDSLAYIYKVNFDFAYSLPLEYTRNHLPSKPLIKGYGAGLDLGVVYMRTTKGHVNGYPGRICEKKFENYRYKIAASLTDFGFISFNKKAEVLEFRDGNTIWEERYDTLPDTTISLIKYKLDHYFSSYHGESLKASKFTMFLPAAFRFDFDYNFSRSLYAGTGLIYTFSVGKSYTRMPTLLYITPRYEKPSYEFSLPVSVYEWNFDAPRIGVYARWGSWFAGSDKIGGFFGLSDFEGMDVYIGVRLNFSYNLGMYYVKGNCGKRRDWNIETFDYRNF